ncbi:MAG TPA: lipopolysaccharide kinase InaA family protein, partial [Steroidobacteraceae bacterium]|nr:lipopolysaccharide kinase InaA family protein [Steroidobacteraceae bacterium]
MLYDPSRVGKPGEHLFSRDHWRALGALVERTGGRGSVCHLQSGSERWVLRHYRRGGVIARLLGDRYLYTTRARTRAFREY